MSWFKVDDGLPVSRKVMSIPRTIRLSSIGLWTLAGAWSAAEELDGHVPGFMVAELGGTEKAASALVKSGLWEKVSGGYQFSKWAEYQPTRADMDERRKREADRKREWRKRKRPASVPTGQTVGHHAESAKRPRYPDPTRPDHIDASPLSAAASPTSTRDEQPQRPVSTTFGDGTPIPAPPPDDAPGPPRHLAVVDVPTEIGTAARPSRTPVCDVDRTMVRYAVPSGLPRQVLTQLAEEVARLRTDRNVAAADIETGLAEWARRPNAGPRLLPNLVADAVRQRATPAPKPASKLRTLAELAASERAAEQTRTPDRLEIT